MPRVGVAILGDLSMNMSRDEVARYLADYAAVTKYDSALRQLLLTAGGSVNLREANHRGAVIHWLRTWGCRHLRCADTERTAEALGSWWDAWEPMLPGSEATLTTLNEQAFDLLVAEGHVAVRGQRRQAPTGAAVSSPRPSSRVNMLPRRHGPASPEAANRTHRCSRR